MWEFFCFCSAQHCVQQSLSELQPPAKSACCQADKRKTQQFAIFLQDLDGDVADFYADLAAVNMFQMPMSLISTPILRLSIFAIAIFAATSPLAVSNPFPILVNRYLGKGERAFSCVCQCCYSGIIPAISGVRRNEELFTTRDN